jgi:glyoxylase-like metal-dependent hydrolase (beta-lactamase superfamily II)
VKRLLAWVLGLLVGGCWACPPVQVGLVQVADDLWLRPALARAPDGWTEPTLVWVNAHQLWIVDPGPHRCAGAALRRDLLQRWPGRTHQIINTHAHPQNVLANSAWPTGTPIHALRKVRQQMAMRCPLCLSNLRQSLGAQWMQGTRWVLPNRVLVPGQWLPLGQGRWQVRAHEPAHTESDLSLWNADQGQWFAASLVAWQGLADLSRADVRGWLHAMQADPSAGAVRVWVGSGQAGQAQERFEATQRYLQALHTHVGDALAKGQSVHDLLDWTEPLALHERSTEQLHQHQMNVQRVWHQLEQALFEPSR